MKTFSKILFSLLLLLPVFAFAQIDQNYGLRATQAELPFGNTNVENADTAVAGFIGQIINAFLGVIGVIFLILLIYAGSLWLTAGGNAERVKKGRQILVWSVIGIVVVMSAFIITNFIIGALQVA